MSGLAVPVGFRFHPTEEELVNHYLKKKIHGGNDAEIDNNIPALLGTETEGDDMEWFFFTRKEYKYGTSTRSNRSTKKGYWKITGTHCEDIGIADPEWLVDQRRTEVEIITVWIAKYYDELKSFEVRDLV
ncbi:hypothetical protein ACLB2K_071824 [Fragaria x ananassa]